MESAVMTSSLMSSQSAVGYQQMKRSKRDEATSCWRISRWFSVDDIIGDIIIFSRWFEIAVARISSSRKLQWIQSQRKDFQTQCLYTQTQAIAASSLPVQARRRKTLVYVVSHTVAAVVHLRSLGVLTAAGCGIGSVHAVVRSNLLVEPSEVEEGEM
ncbi:hypothetical protein F511_42498 [Dorcoceras hygrometricum]|uniref:Uncharacterized protein n=1 Tax=Dorcoceras hygrometricum TaxID=472368 RepID=A0A2Z7ADF1_9LAMI|nr:hypothetical protein F511_42498 [Dorcoceras hygrometricum]